MPSQPRLAKNRKLELQEEADSLLEIKLVELDRSDHRTVYDLISSNKDDLIELGWLSECSFKDFDRHYSFVESVDTVRIFTIRHLDEILGMIEYEFKEGRVAVGYWVLPRFRNKGIASMALSILLTIIPSGNLITADTKIENQSSGRVLEKAGFENIGNDGVSHYWILNRKDQS